MMAMTRSSKPSFPPASIDFGLRSRDYAEQRPGFPDSFYARLERFRPLTGARVLDVGTGPGIVAIPLAERGAHVIGTDISENQIKAATELAEARGLSDHCSFELAPAEQSRFANGSFDLITAGQCWHWFDHARALAECTRLLAPGGLLVIAHYCYLPQHSELVRETEALVLELNPAWKLGGFNGLFPWLTDSVVTDAMKLCEQFVYDEDRVMTHESWRGRMRTCNGVGSGGMDEATVQRFDRELAELLAAKYPEPVRVPHRVHAVIAQKIV
jgi:ubiquinone/menaquinone biosynthesis C-methylase UbiE